MSYMTVGYRLHAQAFYMHYPTIVESPLWLFAQLMHTALTGPCVKPVYDNATRVHVGDYAYSAQGGKCIG